jgi:hypothetical protein
VLGKGYCPRHIVSPEHILVVCQGHHGPYGKKMNPHSGNPQLVAEFNEWLAENRPDIVEWVAEHANDTVQRCGKIDWLGKYEEL